MLILDLLGTSFHAVVVFALGKNLVFKFALGHCCLILTLLFNIILFVFWAVEFQEKMLLRFTDL